MKSSFYYNEKEDRIYYFYNGIFYFLARCGDGEYRWFQRIVPFQTSNLVEMPI